MASTPKAEETLRPDPAGSWITAPTLIGRQKELEAIETKFLSRPIIAGPGTACSETYLVAGRFATEDDARRYAQYLRTRFVRFLVSLRKPTQDAAKDVYAFVPDLPLDQDWTDAKLYKRYGLTPDEIAFIESQVAEHDDSDAHPA